jgi:hypothetical protein
MHTAVRGRVMPSRFGDNDLVHSVQSSIDVLFDHNRALHGYYIFSGIPAGYQGYIFHQNKNKKVNE